MAIAVLPQRAGSPLAFRGVECKRGLQARCMLAPNSQQLVRWCLHASRRCISVKAARNGQSGPSSPSDFNLAEYIEAKVENGKSCYSCRTMLPLVELSFLPQAFLYVLECFCCRCSRAY